MYELVSCKERRKTADRPDGYRRYDVEFISLNPAEDSGDPNMKSLSEGTFFYAKNRHTAIAAILASGKSPMRFTLARFEADGSYTLETPAPDVPQPRHTGPALVPFGSPGAINAQPHTN